MRFKVGDLVTLVEGEIVSKGKRADYGKIGRLVRKTMAVTCVKKIMCEHWVIDGFKFLYTEKSLRKIDPPEEYDGNQVGSWDLIPWQPKKERV
jgi:hypothetical protein